MTTSTFTRLARLARLALLALLALLLTLAACGDDDAPPAPTDAGDTARIDTGPPPAGCGGRETPCSALTAATCETQAGCALDADTCTGDATPCFDLEPRTTCEAQQGCRWN